MEPRLLHLIVCDDVHCDSSNYHRINVYGIAHLIRVKPGLSFPVRHSRLTMLVIVWGYRGLQDVSIRVIQDRTGLIAYRNEPRSVDFVGDPEAVVPLLFRVNGIQFPEPGLYWVEALLSGEMIGRQPLRVLTS